MIGDDILMICDLTVDDLDVSAVTWIAKNKFPVAFFWRYF